MSKDKPRYWIDIIILGTVAVVPAVLGWSDMENDPIGRWMFILFTLLAGYVVGVFLTDKRSDRKSNN